MTEQTHTRVSRVIARLAGIEAEDIGPGRSLGQRATPNFYSHDAKPIGFDSLDLIALAMELEGEFCITISDEEVDSPALDHVGGLVAFVQGKLDAKPKTYGDLTPLLEAYFLKRDRFPSVLINGRAVGPSLRIVEQPDGSAVAMRPIPPAETHGDCS
jgi:acyl carrier protein